METTLTLANGDKFKSSNFDSILKFINLYVIPDRNIKNELADRMISFFDSEYFKESFALQINNRENIKIELEKILKE